MNAGGVRLVYVCAIIVDLLCSALLVVRCEKKAFTTQAIEAGPYTTSSCRLEEEIAGREGVDKL